MLAILTAVTSGYASHTLSTREAKGLPTAIPKDASCADADMTVQNTNETLGLSTPLKNINP